MKPLTLKQETVLDIIRKYHQAYGYSPSFADVAEAIGLSKGGARVHIDALVRKGALRKRPGTSRSLVPTEAGRR